MKQSIIGAASADDIKGFTECIKRGDALWGHGGKKVGLAKVGI